MSPSLPQLSTIALRLEAGIAEVRLDRPDKSNAINEPMWQELREAFRWVDAASAARVAVLCGEGRNFCAGIDLAMLMGIPQRIASRDAARSREALRRIILDMQDCFTTVERCRKPVLAAIQGACVGGAIDLVTCCDMRYASAEASFSVREIDVGMAADVGTLQRLPRLVPDGIARELCYTGRNVDAAEARGIGLVNRVFESPQALHDGVTRIAASIAAKSPPAIRGIKRMLDYGRDHSVADGLEYVATWNASMLLSEDVGEALTAMRENRPPRFDD
jgi:enoyl-CoA hydratase